MFFLSCKTPAYNLQDYTGARLILGNGGGFTGKYTEYILFENGQVFKNNMLNETVEDLGRIGKEETQQFFSNFEILGLSEIELHEPGNMNFYISVQRENTIHKLLWNSDSLPDQCRSAKLFYQTALKRIQTLTSQSRK